MAAQIELKSGILDIIPYFRARLNYESNIYREKDDPKDDFVWGLSPGIITRLPVKNHNFEFEYTFNITHYPKYSDYDSFDNVLSLIANLNQEERFQVNISEVYKDITTPESTELARRTERVQNDFSGDIYYKLAPRLHTRIEYGHTGHHYREAVYQDLLDRNNHEITGALHHLLPSGYGTIELSNGEIEYIDINSFRNSGYTQLMAGINGMLTPSVEGHIKLGQHWRNYLDPATEDISIFLYSIEAEKSFFGRNSIELSIKNNVVESMYDVNSHFISDAALFKYMQFLGKRLFFLIGVDGSINRYPYATTAGSLTQRRGDLYLNRKIGIGYRIRKWMFIIDYDYTTRDSNFDVFDYDDYRIFFRINRMSEYKEFGYVSQSKININKQ